MTMTNNLKVSRAPSSSRLHLIYNFCIIVQDSASHVIAVWCRDYRDESSVLSAERALRSEAGARCPLAFKPDIFSAVGVYRNNEWGLRPAIYTSKLQVQTGRGVVESGVDPDWRYEVKKG